MSEEPEMVLVAGTVPGPGAQQGRCAECNAIVWPTSGSLQRAEAEKIKTICIDCVRKVKDANFAGIMEQGRMWSNADYEKYTEEMKERRGQSHRP